MNRTRLLSVLLLLMSYGAAQSTKGGAAEIEQLQVKRDGADVKIEVVLTGAVKPSVETATNPDRLVLTLPGTLSDAKQKRFPLNANGVHMVRVGLNSANPPVTRVVVDLDSVHPYTMSTEGNSVVLRVQPSETQEVVVMHHDGPAPAASAPLVSVFRRKPQASPAPDTTAQTPIPVPPKLPPLSFPVQQQTQQQASNTSSTAPIAKPSATHPKVGSLQQGTVFPGTGTPGAGTVPQAQTVASETTAASAVASTTSKNVVVTPPTQTPTITATANQSAQDTAANAATPAGLHVSVGDAAAGAPSVTIAPPGAAATSTAAGGSTPETKTSAVAASTAPNANQGSSISTAGAPNVTTKVLSATVTPSAPAPTAPAAASTPQGATVANPSGSPPATTTTGTTSTAQATTPSAPQGATVANPLGSPQASASTATSATTPAAGSAPAKVGATVANPLGQLPAASASSTAPRTASQGATVANPLGTTQAAAAQSVEPPPTPTVQGPSVANPLGLAPGQKLPLAEVEPEAAPEAEATAKATEVTPQVTAENKSEAKTENSITAENKSEAKTESSITEVASVVAPVNPAALALRAAHPDFRTSFKVKYVAAGVAYLDGGRSAGLAEGMKLVVRETPTGSTTGVSSGKADDLVAELDVTSVAETSAVADVHTPTRDVKAGDLAYLSSQDEQALAQQSTLSSTRKYPTVISFTEGDTLDEEARAEIPKPPLPSVNRARGRIGFDYMGTSFHGATGGTNANIGLVARLDMTRIGGSYWNASGYWRGTLTSNNYSGQSTLQDLINRTYHLSMTYDNPHSAWVAGFGRMYLPWATSLDTIDGGYIGRRVAQGVTMGVFAGSTPDPTSYSYNPDQKIGGFFVNFEGGDYDGLRYTSTSGGALTALQWKVNRPFLFFENGLYYKRYVSIYDSIQIDNPVAYTAGATPGVGVGRNFLTVRFQPHSRIELDANYNYFRDLPTFDPTLIGTGLLDKYLFQGFSGGGRLEVLKQVWLYANLGRSSRSGDPSASLNEMYGVTFGHIPWAKIRADAHYSRFNSSFGSGYYDTFSLSRNINDSFRLEVIGGKQNFTSSYSSNGNSDFVTGNLEVNMGLHYFFQGGYTVSRGAIQNYNQWLFTMGYRFDSRQRAKAE